jgi:uncharacterized membrane protein YoaK (UPF0700 family)
LFRRAANFLRALTGRERTLRANIHLGYSLAFVAGGINAGGFLAVHQYTSHMTGIVSLMADHWVTGSATVALSGAAAVISFAGGAASSAILIHWARRRKLQSEFALPLLVEALLLLCFGVVGANLAKHVWLFVSMTVMLLCFIMGLQNAIVTKISNSVIRTTHVTGMVTDIGIELGKLIYINRDRDETRMPRVRANREKLRVQAMLLTLFFLGGVAGAFGFSKLGYAATIPLAACLFVLALLPILQDVIRADTA